MSDGMESAKILLATRTPHPYDHEAKFTAIFSLFTTTLDRGFWSLHKINFGIKGITWPDFVR